MKIVKIIFAVLTVGLLFSCSTVKTEIIWVSGVKQESQTDGDTTKYLTIYRGENLQNQKWEVLKSAIKGFHFEEGYLKKIKVKEGTSKDSNSNSTKLILIKELDKKIDSRVALKGHWELVSLNEADLDSTIIVPTLKIDLSTSHIGGSGGCNLYSGNIQQLTTDSISFHQIAGTLMACSSKNKETEYFKALSEVVAYKADKKQLIFLDKTGKKILMYKKVFPTNNKQLSGNWNAIRINGKNILQNKETPQLLIATKERRISGTNGCNFLKGEIKDVSSSNLVFGPLGLTRKACKNMEVPQEFIKALGKVTQYKLEGDLLILQNKEGKEVLAFSAGK